MPSKYECDLFERADEATAAEVEGPISNSSLLQEDKHSWSSVHSQTLVSGIRVGHVFLGNECMFV